MIPTSFLVDGFNLYHSVKAASHDLGLSGNGTRWLDIRYSFDVSIVFTFD